jgi:DNA ligase-1
MSDFKPMLAGKFDPNKIVYPALVSPKLDGIRCCIYQGQALTRSLKEIPNKHIFGALSAVHLEGLDGELIIGSPCAHDVYRVTNSAVMSFDGEPEFKYFVFDNFNSSGGFEKRNDIARQMALELPAMIEWLPQHKVTSLEEILSLEESWLLAGYEGIIIRSADGPYKYGRSTTNEGWLIKKKNFHDSEARIIGFQEMMHNRNEAFQNELGRTARSKAAEGMEASGLLGALFCEELSTGITFNLGSGLDLRMREEIFKNKDYYMGKIVKFKSFKIGVKDAPRHPVFLGFRDPKDMSS